MAGNPGVIGQFREEVEQATQGVAKDVKDAVGEMIEQGVQSVTNTKLTPQQLQPFDTSTTLSAQGRQKQQEDQKKIAETRRVIEFYKKTEEDLRRVREQKKQEQTQKQQAEKQEEKDKKQEKFIKKEDSKQRVREDIARSRAEIGKGHGIGG